MRGRGSDTPNFFELHWKKLTIAGLILFASVVVIIFLVKFLPKKESFVDEATSTLASSMRSVYNSPSQKGGCPTCGDDEPPKGNAEDDALNFFLQFPSVEKAQMYQQSQAKYYAKNI